jgi:hypothetical protein
VVSIETVVNSPQGSQGYTGENLDPEENINPENEAKALTQRTSFDCVQDR